MTRPQHIKRFRINPIEIVLFSIVTLVFINSVYQLFYGWKGIQDNPISTQKESLEIAQDSRKPASIERANDHFANYDFSCETDVIEKTTASKVRLNGPLCAQSDEGSTNQVLKTEIINQSNQTSATVFSDVQDKRISTDYIPLVEGENNIMIKFKYKNGSEILRKVTLNKN